MMGEIMIDLTPAPGIDSQDLQRRIDETLLQYKDSVRWQLTHGQNIEMLLVPLLRVLFSETALLFQKRDSTHSPATKNVRPSHWVNHVEFAVRQVTGVYEDCVLTHTRTHQQNIELGLRPILTQVLVEFTYRLELEISSQLASKEVESRNDDDENRSLQTSRKELENMNDDPMAVSMQRVALVKQFLSEYFEATTWKLTHHQLVYTLLQPLLSQFLTMYLTKFVPPALLSAVDPLFAAKPAFTSYLCKHGSERWQLWASASSNVITNSYDDMKSQVKAIPRKERVKIDRLVDIVTKDICNRYYDAILLRRTTKENIFMGLKIILESALVLLEEVSQEALVWSKSRAVINKSIEELISSAPYQV